MILRPSDPVCIRIFILVSVPGLEKVPYLVDPDPKRINLPQYFLSKPRSTAETCCILQGKIHSIQNKQILLEFSLPGSGDKALAKLIPGLLTQSDYETFYHFFS